jgi:hypothetical protein
MKRDGPDSDESGIRPAAATNNAQTTRSAALHDGESWRSCGDAASTRIAPENRAHDKTLKLAGSRLTTIRLPGDSGVEA